MVTVSAAPDFMHGRVWTPAALVEMLDEPRDFDLDWRRFEIVDGVLVVSPPALPRHELIVMELGVALHGHVPAGYRLIGSAGIGIGRSYRVTDVTVLTNAVINSGDWPVPPAEVLLAVEIESPSSITTDRITKPAQYAAAGVPFYWRIETDPVRLVAYRLGDGVYEEIGSWAAGEVAQLAEPFSVEIDINRSVVSLTARRPTAAVPRRVGRRCLCELFRP